MGRVEIYLHLTLKQAARRLGLSPDKTLRLAEGPALRGLLRNGQPYFRLADVNAYLARAA